MNDKNWDVLDPPRSKLRALAATLEQQISALDPAPGPGSAQVASVVEAWRALSTALDLGPEPLLRACVSCRRNVPTEATRCRYCMASFPAAGGAP